MDISLGFKAANIGKNVKTRDFETRDFGSSRVPQSKKITQSVVGKQKSSTFAPSLDQSIICLPNALTHWFMGENESMHEKSWGEKGERCIFAPPKKGTWLKNWIKTYKQQNELLKLQNGQRQQRECQ